MFHPASYRRRRRWLVQQPRKELDTSLSRPDPHPPSASVGLGLLARSGPPLLTDNLPAQRRRDPSTQLARSCDCFAPSSSQIDVGVDVREICSSSTAENITEACFNAFAGMFEHIGSATLPYQYYDGFCNGVTTEQESLTDECAASVLGFVNSVAPGAAVGPSLGILCNPGGASPETPRPVGECDYSAYDGGNTNPYTDEWCKATCDAHERGCTGYSRRTRICFIHHTDVEVSPEHAHRRRAHRSGQPSPCARV